MAGIKTTMFSIFWTYSRNLPWPETIVIPILCTILQIYIKWGYINCSCIVRSVKKHVSTFFYNFFYRICQNLVIPELRLCSAGQLRQLHFCQILRTLRFHILPTTCCASKWSWKIKRVFGKRFASSWIIQRFH